MAAIACDFYLLCARVLAELAAIFVVGTGLTPAWWVRAFFSVLDMMIPFPRSASVGAAACDPAQSADAS
jgi:hypothetical protein